MKLVSPKMPLSVRRENSFEFNFHIFDETYGKFYNSKLPLTDSQNKILDSKPTSMGEFISLMYSIDLENLKK